MEWVNGINAAIAETQRVAQWSFGAVLVIGGVLAGVMVIHRVFFHQA